MLSSTSKSFKKRFLLQFTKELIKATKSYKEAMVKEAIKQNKEEPEKKISGPMVEAQKILNKESEIKIKNIVKDKIKKDFEHISNLEKRPFERSFKEMENPLLKKINEYKNPEKFKTNIQQQIQSENISPRKPSLPPILRIYEPPLPATVQYIKPIPNRREIDLGKLNPLIKDPLVKVIECNGSNEKIIVMGIMGRKPTPITLNEEDIEDVIYTFSENSRIPVHEGIFKAVVGNLIISALVSEVIESKFIIRKVSDQNLKRPAYR